MSSADLAREEGNTMNENAYRDAERALWLSVDQQPDEKVVTLATTGTNVRVQLIGSGPPILFIHGGPNSGSTWAPIVGTFDRYTRILVDRPGTGLSEPFRHLPSVGEFHAFADHFVADVLDGLEIDTAHIVASSLGGFIALRSGAATPDRVVRMVQMACPAMVPGMQLPLFMKLMTITAFRRITGVLPPNERVGDNILRQIGHGKSLDAGRVPQNFKDWYLALQKYTDTMRSDGDLIGMVGSYRKGMNPDLVLGDEVFGAVVAPTLYLWGADDTFGDEKVARDVAAMMPNASLEMIPDAGHLPWIDFPDEIGRRSRSFIDSGS
jgi:2-hydroxy-6-oxonona-2,4-dienedioate hydrolase